MDQGRVVSPVFVGRGADAAPLILVIEDLHWADRSSLEFLAYLCHGLHRQRVAIVCTHRDDEVPAAPALGAWLADWRHDPRLTEVSLARFTPHPRPPRLPSPLVTLATPPPGLRPLAPLQHPPPGPRHLTYNGRKEVTQRNRCLLTMRHAELQRGHQPKNSRCNTYEAVAQLTLLAGSGGTRSRHESTLKTEINMSAPR